MYAAAYGPRQLRRRRPLPAWKILSRRFAMGVAVFLFLLFAMAQAVQGSSNGAYMTITVEPGDTVWSIASDRYPGADTRDKVGEILRANGLQDPRIYAGEQLRVPTS